jgi:hypothetical protein
MIPSHFIFLDRSGDILVAIFDVVAMRMDLLEVDVVVMDDMVLIEVHIKVEVLVFIDLVAVVSLVEVVVTEVCWSYNIHPSF